MKKRISWGLVFLGMLLTGICFGRTLGIVGVNRQTLLYCRPTQPDSPYAQGIPLDEMDLSYFARETYNRSHSEHKGGESVITLQRDLCYYAKLGGEPVLEYKTGERVVLGFDPGGTPSFYADAYSLPTYERGWRFTRPVLKEGAKASDVNALTPLYVRLDDLRYLLSERVNDLPERDRRALTTEAQRDRFLLTLDQTFCSGTFISPELLRPVWDELNTALLSAAVVFIAIGLLLSRCLRRQPPRN